MSEFALQLIEENKKTRAKFLDLGNSYLSAVPEEIAELVWLEALSFSSEWWDLDGRKTSCHGGPTNNIQKRFYKPWTPPLNPLLALKNLKRLWLRGNINLIDLSPLAELMGLELLDISNTKAVDLSPLVELKRLQVLYVSGIRFTDLSLLAGLAGLQILDVSHTPVTDLTPLSGLASLRTLDVSHTPVTDLTPLSGLAGLRTLDVSHTPVTDLLPLARVTGLHSLNISYTPIFDLSPLLPLIKQGIAFEFNEKSVSSDKESICVTQCPLINPPHEIVQQGKEAILNYFKEKETQGIDHLYEAKLLIVGEGGAGKTSLLRRLYQSDKPLPEEAETTKGIDIHRHEFKLENGRVFRLNVWDFGGQEIYHATHQFFLTKRSLYVLLDDTRKDNKSVQDKEFKYWLDVVDQLSEHSPVLIFQNEKGGRGKTIDLAGIKGRFDNVKDCYRGNLENIDAAEELRKAVAFYAAGLPHIGDALPARWVAIRNDIEHLAVQKPYISLQEYFDLYGKQLEFDRYKALHLSRYFHDLGVFLHYQDDLTLAKTVILQNTAKHLGNRGGF